MYLRQLTTQSVALIGALCITACGDGTGGSAGSTTPNAIPQCEATGYVAFDTANHQNQDIRLGVVGEMNTLMSEAKTDFTLAADRFAQAKALYTDLTASASLRDKVQGRKDDHLVGSPLQGDRLDATIIEWLDKGAAATTDLEANIAKQWVDKTLVEFFFLSVQHELVAGSRKHWDEAFGYFGAKSDNDEANLEGLAMVTFKRDSNNGTNLRAEVFNNLIDGSCELEKALRDADVEEIDPTTSPAVNSLIEDIDLRLQKVLAYSAGHEAVGIQDVIAGGLDVTDPQDTDKMFVKAAELTPYVEPLLRLMQAKGGDPAVRGAEIQTFVDLVDFNDLTSTGWMTSFDPARIIELLEAEYGIDIKG